MCDFVHLHVHSEYSLLDGLGRTAQLAKEAARLGQKALALTDHGVMHGAVEFFRDCQKQGVKPIVGVEAYMTQHGRKMSDNDPVKDKKPHHLLLLAQNMTGYKNLLKLSSEAQLNGYYYKPRIDADLLAQYSEGLICTTGCMAAEIPYWLNAEQRAPNEELALERLRWYLDVFGRERFFIELQEHNIPELTRINKKLFEWSKTHNIELLVTNDVHYVTADDAQPHDTLLCVQTNSLVTQQKRMRLSDHGYYLKSEAEMRELFRPLTDLPDSAFTNSVKIAEMCEISLEDDSFHLPDLPDQPYEVMPQRYQTPDKDYAGFLRYLTEKGVQEKYGERANEPEVQQRMEHELNIINRMNFAVYFLIVWDLCRYARQNNIWWNVRGSGAGSIVAYATGITLIDPLRNNLIFERFLNPGRVSMPDFDLDYPDDQRELMIKYALETYGPERVAQIVSFGRMKARAAIRDVGRAMDIPLDEVDRIAKMIAAIPGKPVTIDNVLDPDHEFYSAELKQMYEQGGQYQELVDFARNLEGVARHSSVHAAAVIVTDKPLVEYVPVMRPSGDAVITPSVTQFEFPICESIGLLKVDFLGLSTLTVMRKAAELIEDRHGVRYTIENINVHDQNWSPLDPNLGDNHLKKAFDLLSSGNTTGVFQVEGQGMTNMLREMKPFTFEHVVAAISLYRPGPMDYIPDYIRRMHGEEDVEFQHEILEKILSETYAIIVYQEQIIQIASEMAGYSPGEADLIRKAVGKKKKKEIDAHKDKFIAGAVANGIETTIAKSVWADIEKFARYGFNKAHSADYSMVTCQTAYLKANYLLEYMTALLTVERNNTDKVSGLMTECRALGIKVLPPHINHSRIVFVIDDESQDEPAIRFGISAIKNVGEGSIREILNERDADGMFVDLDDFCERVDLRKVGRRALEGLIKVGALSCFHENRNLLLELVDRMISLSSSTLQAAAAGQASMFGAGMIETPQAGSLLSNPPFTEPPPKRDIREWEKELVGITLSENAIHSKKQWRELQAAGAKMLDELTEAMDGQFVLVSGVINLVRPHKTKKGDDMAFVELEDNRSSCELVVFPSTYALSQDLLEVGKIVFVQGKIDGKGRGVKILANKISKKFQVRGGRKSASSSSPRRQKNNATPPKRQVAEPKMSYNDMPPTPFDEEPPHEEMDLPFESLSPHPPPSQNGNGHAPPPPPSENSAPPPAAKPKTAPPSSPAAEPEPETPPTPEPEPPKPEPEPEPSTESTAAKAEEEPPPKPVPAMAPVNYSFSDADGKSLAEQLQHVTTRQEVLEVLKNDQPRDYGDEELNRLVNHHAPLLIHVYIMNTGNIAVDKHRMKTVFNLLTAQEGADQFKLHIISKNKQVITPPLARNSTYYSERLIIQLMRILKPDAVSVESLHKESTSGSR